MYLTKPKRIEKLNSISDCFNGLVDNLQKKKNIHDRNFKLRMSSNSNAITNELNENNRKKEFLSLDKVIHQQNFDKKYSKIMSSVSPKAKDSDLNPQKNLNLWDLKLKSNSSIDKDQSLKRLEDLKLRMVYHQDLEKSDEQKQFSQTFKKSSSSDFFKSTANSESKTFSSSKNSFYKNNINSNFSGNQSNFNNERNENLSFNSFKSVSSGNNLGKKFSEIDVNLSPKSSNGKTKRVNFDDFNNIGENPFKINMYDNNSMLNNSRKKYSKYGNMKEGYNLSPKNICSPFKDSLNYHSNKQVYRIDDIYEKSPNTRSKKDSYSGSKLLKSPSQSSNSVLNKSGVSTAFISTRQYTMKRIDNLLKNFTHQSPQKISLNSPKTKNKNPQGSFLKNNDTKRLYNLLQ